MGFRVIECATGRIVGTVSDLWPNDVYDCSMCGEFKKIDHAAGYYCGFTRDEIGSVTTEYTDGGIVGGMCICKSCHDKFYNLQG